MARPPLSKNKSNDRSGSNPLPTIYASSDFEEFVLQKSQELGYTKFAEFGRDALAFFIQQKGIASPNTIHYELSDEELKQLDELDAQTLGMQDKNNFARWIVRRVAHHGADIVQKLMQPKGLSNSSTSAIIDETALTAEEIAAGKRHSRIKEAARQREEEARQETHKKTKAA